ncbi:DNA double-strand break repair ATPase Rad50 [Halomarina litorea]|uniref:DNA double-strand break repair ATPase Rad50 n=1 Tax=Halomarina litorea TaxID=2961595 RepID=UPI0020C27108|nr:DNA double-strand break repair ATPase Rad50 [Halomarina sp. BCD28]
MRFERVRLENFKCYADADLTLGPGVTVIHGLNGSGKSSLLEACFFALYGAKALDTTLDEVVTIGAEEATVELWFAHGGEEYHIERRVRNTGERATTAKCVLETPGDPVEGARDVRGYVADLLRMDAGAFVNCAYVRQGEVNKLINASPSQRQDMIDDLLQLGTLEEYRERASNARIGVNRVLDGKRELLDDTVSRIEEKEGKDLHATLNELETERNELAEKIEAKEEKRKQAERTRDHYEGVLEEAAEKRERLEEVEERIESLQSKIAETERERDQQRERLSTLREAIEAKADERDDLLAETGLDAADPDAAADRLADLRERTDDLRDRIEDLRLTAQEESGRADRLVDEADEREERAASKREEAADLESTVEDTEERLVEERERVADLESTLEAKREAFEDAPCELGAASDHRESVAETVSERQQAEATRKTELKNARESLEEAERLKAEGKCPECGQAVEGSPHVEAIEERREAVADLEAALDDAREERETAEARLERADELVELEGEIEQAASDVEARRERIAEREATVESQRERIATLREEAETLETAAAERRETAEEAEAAAAEARAAIGEVNGERMSVKERVETLESLRKVVDDIADHEAERERLREDRAKADEVNEERRERLGEQRERRERLAEEFDETTVEEARANKRGAEEYIEYADEELLPKLRGRHDETQSRIGAIRNELDALADLRERREELAATVERLESLSEETEELQAMYADLRAELRQRNVRKLEALLNETFSLVYQNDSYARIQLDGDYALTVYQKDGEALEPEQLSGGERALFNLSLRCAIYRLLAEGIEGAAPMPPLILDEPTVFLDSGHVSKLVELIESMRQVGVEQIVVVSHDEELVGAADDLVQVEKDPTTNRSAVTRSEAAAVLTNAD